jgi:hypothetical protein
VSEYDFGSDAVDTTSEPAATGGSTPRSPRAVTAMAAGGQRLAGYGRRFAGRGRKFAGQVKRGLARRARKTLAGLPRPSLPKRQIEGIPASTLATQRRRLAGRRTFDRDDLDAVARLLESADEVVPIREAFARREAWPERFLAMRHDMDHDVENSVRLAEWEAAHGWRSTYYVLHGDWYWGTDPVGEPSKLVLRALDRIASLGHEIGLHNNVLTLALRTGRDPREILESALGSLRRHGFDVTGSVAHGDPLCHAAGYVNYEIFAEHTSPTGLAADRTISYDDPTTGAHYRLDLRPVPMADFGLEYEANTIGHTLYLSDTGGHWSVPFDGMAERFRTEGGFLQVLMHPVWWALSGENVKRRPAIVPIATSAAEAASGSGAEFRVVVRGDCCSRRAISMNPDLFGGNPVMARDEKARTDFFLDHLSVGSATREDVVRLLDVDAMSPSLRQYALGQTDRTTLSEGSARLLAMDDYSDMNFAAWRNRRQGWKLWVHPKFIRDRAAFEREYEPVGQLSFEDSLQLHTDLIERYRARNGHIPVMYLHQPIAYYPKLDPRADFRRLGLELERTVPDVYFGDIADADLDPDDLGSCGPGKTLHFTGPTYRKMIDVALQKGLAQWLTPAPSNSTS